MRSLTRVTAAAAIGAAGLVLFTGPAGFAAPVTNTFSVIDGFSSTPPAALFNFGVGTIDATFSEGGPDPGDYAMSGRATAYATTVNGAWRVGARAELTAEFVPESLWGTGPFYTTAETKAIGQIEDQLTFTAQCPAAQPSCTITGNSPLTVIFTYSFLSSCAAHQVCSISYGPNEIAPTGVYGEVLAQLGAGFDELTGRVDIPGGGGTFTHTFVVANGATQRYLLQLTARVFSNGQDAVTAGMAGDPGFFHVKGVADFSSTLTLVGIRAVAADGTPLDLTVHASDGVALQPVSIPEASLSALIAAGAASLASRVRRSRTP
jgi:hypothetical protein